MLSYPLRWVPTAAVVLVYLTQCTNTSTVSLLNLMPKCASECVESFISTEYPKNACSKGCDLNYLCKRNTTSGYTLGEAALRCSLSLCSLEVALSFDTYSICNSVPGALPQTHPTIVATIASPPNPTSTTRLTTLVTTHPETTNTYPATESSPESSTKTDHSSTTTTFENPTSATDSTTHTSSAGTDEPTPTTSTDPSPSATSDETSGAPTQGSSLNSGAVIGVSVASGIAGFFIIGVIIFFCCRKIRRKAQDREFFEIGGHMSEPLDFSFPPRRPPMGPRPSPGTLNPESESARLVPPVDSEYQPPAHYPAVVVTQPEEDPEYRHTLANNTDRTGVQSSSNIDFDAASIASSRTVSDLLPDKPTYELYPRPLRWSQEKKSRPSSEATFSEDNCTGSRELPSPPLQQSGFTPGSGKGKSRIPMAGLPPNPRAMMYGFGGPGEMVATKGTRKGKRPVYSYAKENIQPSRQAGLQGAPPYRPGHMDYDDDLDGYWQNSDAGFVGAKVIQPHGAARGAGMNRNSFGDYPGYDFEFGFGDYNNIGSDSRRTSHYSGGFRPLTPVREICTPMGEAQDPIREGSNDHGSSVRYPERGLNNQPQKVISRPRIVRQDDIKRVQIRRGKVSPKEVTVPYCPDDYWLEQSNEQPSVYNPPGAPEGKLGMPKKKPSLWERNLTPSRRGADLILQVE
ncbi:hypothetical protein ASPSYDRAFT_87243 [Aspergillus sydowii CBS 593.65]|uniref:Extracellular membrane protein CFEM domain-containing protein n=1 Tax=Aspergillus sydowii CBS 593.65 TaxID=1036612 RepID=A0A1L9TMY4_9EURO|nr:uncharacterized protein ASPSYDRAFT_87243 [Aspergillus sydowii CBS 593.65]OJJ60663.1 hypothetical protein ASPSYDRAFT_87243 [Aspergillus sydowii CBS 593.65]